MLPIERSATNLVYVATHMAVGRLELDYVFNILAYFSWGTPTYNDASKDEQLVAGS